MEIEKIDLNLLVAFDALMRERSVSRAAQVLCLSQSGLSHALGRLRSLLDDQVLVKTSTGMTPTPRALMMEQPVREALGQLSRSLSSGLEFDPATSEKTFFIYSVEYFEAVVLPLLASRFEKIAPGVSLIMEALPDELPEGELSNGKADLVVGLEGAMEVPERLQRKIWLDEPMVCLVREGLGGIGAEMSLEQYIRLSHVFVSPFGPSLRLVDSWLERLGLERRIMVTAKGFFCAARVAERTDYVLTVPRRFADAISIKYRLKIVELPPEFPSYRPNLIWHPLYEEDPAHRWLRKELMEIVGGWQREM